MRDLITIAAAGLVMSAFALLTPSLVEAVPNPVGSAKLFTQRLPQAGGAVPVSARIDTVTSDPERIVVARRPLLVGISAGTASR